MSIIALVDVVDPVSDVRVEEGEGIPRTASDGVTDAMQNEVSA